MKVIIAGSRSITDIIYLRSALETAYEFGAIPYGMCITEVVSGNARGVDRLGEYFAEEQGIYITRFIPDWDKYGRAAGFRRNEAMAHYADALIAVWDGRSRGTNHMIETMKRLKKPYFVYLVHT